MNEDGVMRRHHVRIDVVVEAPDPAAARAFVRAGVAVGLEEPPDDGCSLVSILEDGEADLDVVPTCDQCGGELEVHAPVVERRRVLRYAGPFGSRVLFVSDAFDGDDDGDMEVKCGTCGTRQELDFEEMRIE